MIYDTLTTFADGEETGNTGTRLIGDTIDLQVARDVGNGQPLYLFVVVRDGITAASAGTYQVKLTSGTSDALAGARDHIISPVFVTGTSAIPEGTVLLQVPLPVEGNEYQRYLGIQEVVGTQNTTAGEIDAFLTLDPSGWKSYPQGAVQG